MKVFGLLASLAFGLTTAEASELTFFVSSSDGNDRNPGTISKPFLTIERARDAIVDYDRRAAASQSPSRSSMR